MAGFRGQGKTKGVTLMNSVLIGSRRLQVSHLST